MPLLTTHRTFFFLSLRFVVCRFCTGRQFFVYKRQWKKNNFVARINSKISICFWCEKWTVIYFSFINLFLLFFVQTIPLQVDKSTASVHEFPLTMDPPPTAIDRQFTACSAATPKKCSSLQHCFSSDGCFDVQKFIQHQVASRECSLWRTSTTLNLIHGVCESLSAGKHAHAIATGIKKTRAPWLGYVRE